MRQPRRLYADTTEVVKMASLNEARQAMIDAKKVGLKAVFYFDNGDTLKSVRGVYKRLTGSYRKSASLSSFSILYVGPNGREYKSLKVAKKAADRHYAKAFEGDENFQGVRYDDMPTFS
jgi:hypothetical protein